METKHSMSRNSFDSEVSLLEIYIKIFKDLLTDFAKGLLREHFFFFFVMARYWQ